MNFSFLSPVSETVLEIMQDLSMHALGSKVRIHSEKDGLPNLDGVSVAIIGVLEQRNSKTPDTYLHFNNVRNDFYNLFPGSWNTTIADLGDLKPGETVEDTYFALKETLSILINKKIIPIVLGGSQDLTYANYRAYDALMPMVNVVNVDACFDLGDASKSISDRSFVGKIILDEPYNLFNYAAIGYQTYFNSQEELDLIKKLYFEAYRLGDVSSNIRLVEPVMRDAHLVSIDLNAVKASEVSVSQQISPNGFDGKEICAIARYAGISNKLSSFGIYNYKVSINDSATSMLLAQMIWYFIEGLNGRVKDDDFSKDEEFQKFITLVEDQELIFFKSLITNRWWVEIPFLSTVNTKLKKHTLLPCTLQDYKDACNNIIPERWFKAFQKNSL